LRQGQRPLREVENNKIYFLHFHFLKTKQNQPTEIHTSDSVYEKQIIWEKEILQTKYII